MLESLDFHYNGISSKDMGLMNVRMDSGLFEEIFLANRSINKVKVKGTDKSYFQSIERDDISIPLSFAFMDGFTEDQLREVKRWFSQDYYKEFYFDDYPHKVFYLMYSENSSLHHNGIGQGYFTITLESNSPYSYSHVYTTSFIDVNDVVNGYVYEFTNNGDLPIYPELWISNCLYQNVKIHNLSNGVKFEMSGITTNETVYVDNEKKDIITDIPSTYRYDNFNDEWLKIDRGLNRLLIIGDCNVQFRYQLRFI